MVLPSRMEINSDLKYVPNLDLEIAHSIDENYFKLNEILPKKKSSNDNFTVQPFFIIHFLL